MRRTIEIVWRMESARLIAGLSRITRALITALEQWPASGIPDNPGAWLPPGVVRPKTGQMSSGRTKGRDPRYVIA